jgi:hypothetical protein
MDSGRTHLWRARQKNLLPLLCLAAGCGVYRGYTKMGDHPSNLVRTSRYILNFSTYELVYFKISYYATSRRHGYCVHEYRSAAMRQCDARCYGTRSPLQDHTRIIDFTL